MIFSGLGRSGSREREIAILLPGVEQPVKVLVRATSAFEDAEASRFAIEQARLGGIESPKDGDELYDVARWAAVVATAYIDPDSPPAARRPFFDGGPHQVRGRKAGEGLPTESIVYLFQEQQRWQEEVSPSFKAQSASELVASVKRLLERDAAVFFSRCSPATQTSLALFMAGLCASSLATTSPSSSLFAKSALSARLKPIAKARPRRHPRTDR